MTRFSDIITTQDQELVEQAKLDIRRKTIKWCHELWFYKALIYRIGR